jgi:hypothetical protein
MLDAPATADSMIARLLRVKAFICGSFFWAHCFDPSSIGERRATKISAGQSLSFGDHDTVQLI